MHEAEKIEVKSEPFIKVEYKIKKDVCDKSKPVVNELQQELCMVYKDENNGSQETIAAEQEYLKLEDDTFDVKIETIKMEQHKTVTVQKEREHESESHLDGFDMCYNTETIIVEEVQIKDDVNTQKPFGSLKSANSNNSSYVCNVCQYKTEVKQRFKKHIDAHIGEKSYVCNVCYFRTTTKEYLGDHKKIHAGNRKYSKCFYCDYKSTKKSNLSRHMDICKVRLEQCGVSLEKKKSKLPVNDSNDTEKHFKCDQCDYTSSFKCSLGNHKKIHLNKIHRCNHCDYTTSKQHEFTLHVMIHDGKQPYECGICGYKAAFKTNLQRHVLKHAEIKPFKCDQCAYSTYRKHHLTSHLLVHTRKKSVKPFRVKLVKNTT